jgi:hypothetical protein
MQHSDWLIVEVALALIGLTQNSFVKYLCREGFLFLPCNN